MLDNVQILKEKGESKFAVIDFEEYLYLKGILSDPCKLQDHLDYLHIQETKLHVKKTFSLNEVKAELGL